MGCFFEMINKLVGASSNFIICIYRRCSWWFAWEKSAKKAFCQKWSAVMESFLYQTKPTARQMYLEPRTKIFLCITVVFITLTNCEQGMMGYAKTCVAFVPLVNSLLPWIRCIYQRKYRFRYQVCFDFFLRLGKSIERYYLCKSALWFG